MVYKFKHQIKSHRFIVHGINLSNLRTCLTNTIRRVTRGKSGNTKKVIIFRFRVKQTQRGERQVFAKTYCKNIKSE